MLSILSRRELLSVGSIGMAGLSLPTFLKQQASAAPAKRAKADAVIFLYLQGSPSHIDTWDPRPDAPVEIRGEFKPIQTSAPGVILSEVLPMLARQAHRFALIRSLGVKPKGLTNHGAAIYMLMTGHDPGNFTPTGLAVQPTREDLPSFGSVIARHRPSERGSISYASLCFPVREGSVSGVGQGAGLLGGTYDPFPLHEDPNQSARTEAFTLPADTTLGRMQARIDLRSSLAGKPTLGPRAFDGYYDTALSLIASSRARRAFRLEDEEVRVRDRYGLTRFGQSCLLARRLVEAGTRFIQVNWPAGSDTEPVEGLDGSWDTHRNNFPMLRKWRCPVFDRAASALIGDLSDRGLLDTTLVVMAGEFGRSPKIGAPTTNNVGPGGRDHWPECYTALIAGGGVRGGQAYGASDRNGAYPAKNPVHPYDLVSTIHYALGIDINTEYRDTLNRPRRLVEHGGPVVGLF